MSDFKSSNHSEVEELRAKRSKTMVVIGVMAVIFVVVSLYFIVQLMGGNNIFGDSGSLDEYMTGSPLTSDSSDEAGTLEYDAYVDDVWDTPVPVAQTLNYVSTSPDSRMLSLPQNGKVNLEYFRTSLIIGDSLAQGFAVYQPLLEITTVAGYKGIGPREIISNNSAQLADQTYVPAWDYITQQTPTSIYIAMGTNALISLPDDEGFLKYYGDFLDMLKVQFPTTPIYLNSITPVSQAEAERRPAMSNERIAGLNNALSLMAQEKGIFYLNVNEILADETGALREDITQPDGYHIKPQGYVEWVDYMATHTVYSPYNLQFLEVPYDSENA